MSNTAGLPQGGYGIVQRWVMKNPQISRDAKALYALLISYSGDKNYCWPSQATIARDLGFKKPDSVARYVRELVQHRLIKKAKAGHTYQGQALGFKPEDNNLLYFVCYYTEKPAAVIERAATPPPAKGGTLPHTKGAPSPPQKGTNTNMKNNNYNKRRGRKKKVTGDLTLDEYKQYLAESGHFRRKRKISGN